MEIQTKKQNAIKQNFLLHYFFRIPAWLLIFLLWAGLFVPNTGLKAIHDEEGRRAFLTMDILENGNWLAPEILGTPYIYKPPLQPWLMAVSSTITGGLNEWAVRLPALFMTLVGALLVFEFTRLHASRAASLWAASFFLLSPLVMERARLGETDTTMTVMILAAFYTWWRAEVLGRINWQTWGLCGICLCLASLAKGPVAIPFFVVPVCFYMIIDRQYKTLAGPVLAALMALAVFGGWWLAVYEPGNSQIWAEQMRPHADRHFWLHYLLSRGTMFIGCLAALLPWLVFSLPVVVPRWAKRFAIESNISRMLFLYVFSFSVFLVFYPDMRSRYLMPITPALAIATGMAWSAFGEKKGFRSSIVALSLIMVLYQLTVNYILLPNNKESYAARRESGMEIGQLLADKTEAIYVVRPDYNMLFYAGLDVQEISIEQVGTLKQAGYLILPESLQQDLMSDRNDHNFDLLTPSWKRQKNICIISIKKLE